MEPLGVLARLDSVHPIANDRNATGAASDMVGAVSRRALCIVLYVYAHLVRTQESASFPYRLFARKPAFFAAGLPRPIMASFAFRDCLPNLGASLTSPCFFITRYTVDPTLWSCGRRDSALATCLAAVLNLALRARPSPASDPSSLSSPSEPSSDAASRKSAGRTAGSECLSSLLRVAAGARLGMCSRGCSRPSLASPASSAACCFEACFPRASACSLKRASRSWRLRFWSSCCLWV